MGQAKSSAGGKELSAEAGRGVRVGVVAEESNQSWDGPEVRFHPLGLSIDDRRLADADPHRNLPLQEPQVQTPFPDVVAD